jgi:hypothetical protein
VKYSDLRPQDLKTARPKNYPIFALQLNQPVMKQSILIVVISLFLFSCKKNTGTVLYNINFINHAISEGKGSADKKSIQASDIYNQFGDYITSLTPEKFTANIWTIGYIDKVMERNSNAANMLQYIEQNGEKLPGNDPTRLVDFSDNNVVSFNPVIYGRVNNNHQFEDARIDFRYFYFIPFSLYQEIPLPSGYQGVTLDMFPGGSVSDNTLKINHKEIFRKLYPNGGTNNCFYLIFGNTDSTWVVNPNSENVGLSEDCPIAEPGRDLVIRSNRYTNMIFNQPGEGNTAVMNGTLSIDTKDFIQVYAGADNIPYTSDDVFVYAPRFWERITSRLDVN